MSIASIGQSTLGRTDKFRQGQTVACKCQICNCGSHKCPTHQHVHHYDPSSTCTAYQHDFPKHAITHRPTRDEYVPKQQLTRESGKFLGVTSNKADFPSWDAKPSTPFRPSDVETAIVGATPFDQTDFISEQHAQYGKPMQTQPARSCAPQPRPTTQSKFDGTTTKNQDYKNWNGIGKPATPSKKPQQLHTDGKETRDFQTEAALKFTEHTGTKRASFIPPQRTTHNLPFEGNTTQRTDFHSWPDAKPADRHKPMNEINQEPETRDFSSETSREFNQKQYSVRESFAPKHDFSSHRIPFNGTTSHSQYYKNHHGQPAQLAPRPYDETKDLLTGKDPISFQTESGTQYSNKGYGVRENYKPKGMIGASGEKLDGMTTNRADYKKHVGAEPARLAHTRETHNAAREDRDFASQASTSFVDYGIQKRNSFKPANGGVRNVPFDGETTNRAHFTEHSITSRVCPAVGLPDAKRNSDGHMSFTLHSESKKWTPLE